MREDLGREDIEEIPFSGSSRMELKRSHQWLTEPSGSGLFGNKRQVVETDATRPDCLTPLMSLSSWDDSLVPRQLPDCLFNLSNPQHTSDLFGRDLSPLYCQHIEEGRKYIQDQSNTVSSIGLPVVLGNLETIGNVKLNEVSESSNMLEPMVQFSNEGILRSLETGPSYNCSQDSTLSFGQTISNIDKSFILPGPLDCRADGNFIRHFNNEGVGVIPVSGIYDKEDGNVLPTFHSSEKGVENFVLMGQSLQKADCNVFSTSPSYTKGHENFSSLLSCDKVPENLFMTESYNHKENAKMLSRGPSPWMERGKTAFMVSSQDRANQNNDRISRGDRSKTITFGDHQEEPAKGSSFCGTNHNRSFSHASATAKDRSHLETEEIMSFEFRNPHYTSPRTDTLLVPESKESKRAKRGSTNTFPSNVKSLLSTGMFDGVTVKYYSWSREKNLKGIIKGTGYLCGCDNCNHNKVLNAYEFEQHANCKTKHPNNHIYFENGKTIYGVVQELKNTPQEKLFDAIQNVTGSDINHKNFNTWKASYQIASLELQRIYGKDIVTLGS